MDAQQQKEQAEKRIAELKQRREIGKSAGIISRAACWLIVLVPVVIVVEGESVELRWR
jgi:hypothetical protein